MEETYKQIQYNGMVIFVRYERDSGWYGEKFINSAEVCGKEFNDIKSAKKYIDSVIISIGKL